MQLTPLQSYSMDPVGRSEACTLRSAAACALAQAMQTMAEELPTSNKSVYPSCIPVFVPTFGPLDGFWSGVSCSESSHVFFQSERSLGSSTHDVDVRKTLQARFALDQGCLQVLVSHVGSGVLVERFLEF